MNKMNWQYLEALLALGEAARLLWGWKFHLGDVCKGSSALLGSLGWDISASIRPWSCSAAELQGIGVNSAVMPLGKPAVCGGGWGWTRDGAEGREELDLEMPISVLAQGLEPRSQGWWHQLSGILKSFLCQVLGMDRADQSCLIASSRQQGRIHPSSPGFQLVGLNAGEKETGVWVGMCVMTPKWGVLREKQNEFIRKRRYNREKKIRIWEQKGKGWNIEKL